MKTLYLQRKTSVSRLACEPVGLARVRAVRVAVVLAAIVALAVVGRTTHAADSPLSPDALRGKQEAQQRARDMARELVSGILDVQLEQLEQNGLQKLDLYRDIQTMRKHIDGLVEAEMREVVAILVKAQQGEPAARVEQFNKARAKIREIVTRLAVERQNLARRLRIAELTAQVKMLIEKQTTVMATTSNLPNQPKPRQAEQTLDTIQNQNDIKALFIQLVNALADVATWGGQVGAGAADGLRILKAGQAGTELDNIGSALDSSKFSAAVKSQRSVINTLKALLEKLEGIQGLINSTNEEALALVRDLMKRQEEVRKETKQSDLNDHAAEKLVDREAEIRKDLSKLTAALERLPAATPLLEQAKSATFAATGDLFDAKKPEALNEETKALGSLAELERKLEQASEQEANDKSAAELAQQVKNLEAAQKQVAEAQKHEQAAADTAKSDQEKSAAADQSAADALAKAAEPSPLPAPVKSRLAEAQELARDATKSERSEQSAEAKQSAQQAAQNATDRAAAEIAAALADTKLNQKAVSAGELARAAEALERAAAAEREVAKAADDAAHDKGLSAEDAKKLTQDQMDVKKVAEKIAEGVKDRAPESANSLTEAQRPINDTGHDLVAAEKKPGEANKPEVRDAAEKGAAAAEKISQAAAELRKHVAAEAKELAQIADEQLKPVTEARDNVEKAEGKQPESIAQALDKLNQAAEKTAEAAAQQHRAEGHPQAAAAAELAQQIAKAVEQQKAADQAAKELSQGKTDSSFDAATSEQKVADMATEIAKQIASAPIQKALEKAQHEAAEAAKNTVAGSPQAADANRQEAAKALGDAQKLARDEAKKAAESPAGAPDAAAEKAAAEAATEAQKLAAEAAPAAAEALGEAAHRASSAEQSLHDGNKPAAKQAQAATDGKLDEAARHIAQAIKALSKQEAGQLGQQSGELGQLAKATAPIDPDAGSAIKDAQESAEHVASRSEQKQDATSANDAAADAAQGQGDVAKHLERADASLAARQQRLENAKQLADEIAREAAEQQQARNEIAADAAKLNEASRQQSEQVHGSPPAGSSQALHAAAQALQNAENRFAQAQRQIGQNAEQVSGQAEVANKPIREGLEAASQLGERAQPLAANEPGQTPDSGQDANQGDPSEPGDHAGHPEQGGQSAHHGHGLHGQAEPLGTGIVPSSPEATAEQIAGMQANAAAAAAMAQGHEPGQGQEPGQEQGTEPGQGQKQGQGQHQSAIAIASHGSRAGSKTENPDLPPGPLQIQPTVNAPGDSRTGDDKAHDTDASKRQSKEEPWIAKLPPDVRNALRAKSHQPAPRAYQDRLKKYFENIDE